MAQVVSLPTSSEVRAAVAGEVTFFFWLIWPGWGLYTTRALDAAEKAGETVERIGELQGFESASVVPIATRQKQQR